MEEQVLVTRHEHDPPNTTPLGPSTVQTVVERGSTVDVGDFRRVYCLELLISSLFILLLDTRVPPVRDATRP